MCSQECDGAGASATGIAGREGAGAVGVSTEAAGSEGAGDSTGAAGSEGVGASTGIAGAGAFTGIAGAGGSAGFTGGTALGEGAGVSFIKNIVWGVGTIAAGVTTGATALGKGAGGSAGLAARAGCAPAVFTAWPQQAMVMVQANEGGVSPKACDMFCFAFAHTSKPTTSR